MARHMVHRRSGDVDEYQELPADKKLEADSVTVTFADGSLRSYHAESGLGGVGFEFADGGILVLRYEESDRVLTAFAPTAWHSVAGTAPWETEVGGLPADAERRVVRSASSGALFERLSPRCAVRLRVIVRSWSALLLAGRRGVGSGVVPFRGR
jgi:hypothetical protein